MYLVIKSPFLSFLQAEVYLTWTIPYVAYRQLSSWEGVSLENTVKTNALPNSDFTDKWSLKDLQQHGYIMLCKDHPSTKVWSGLSCIQLSSTDTSRGGLPEDLPITHKCVC